MRPRVSCKRPGKTSRPLLDLPRLRNYQDDGAAQLGHLGEGELGCVRSRGFLPQSDISRVRRRPVHVGGCAQRHCGHEDEAAHRREAKGSDLGCSAPVSVGGQGLRGTCGSAVLVRDPSRARRFVQSSCVH